MRGGCLLLSEYKECDEKKFGTIAFNGLELQAFLYIREHFRSDLKGSPVLLRSDNTTKVAFFNYKGNLRSTTVLNWSRQIVEFIYIEECTSLVMHLPEFINILADRD